jgi:small subunit ribosomal protein S8
MPAQDNVSSLFTAIRNGVTLHKLFVSHQYSGYLAKILKVLQEAGYIGGYTLYRADKYLKFRIFLKYNDFGESVIKEIVTVSKPGQRLYFKARDIKSYKNFCGIYLISTTSGICTDFTARKLNLGGEILCRIF